MTTSGATLSIEWGALESLFHALRSRNYTIVGPTVRQGAIVLDELHSIGDLSQNWSDEAGAETCHLGPRTDEAMFGSTVAHPLVGRLAQSSTLLDE